MSRSGEQLARRAARFGKFVVAIGHNAKRGRRITSNGENQQTDEISNQPDECSR